MPLLFVLPWLSNRFSEIAPPTGSTVVACSEPAAVARALEWRPAAVAEIAGEGCWKLRWPAPDASVEITDAAQVWLRLPLPALTPVVHKHGWLNVLFANPGGYLDDAAPFDALTLALAPREVIAFGPRWMRGWMFAFFVPLLLVSLVIKWRWRIH